MKLNRKCSRFCLWVIAYVVFCVISVIVYAILDGHGFVEVYKNKVQAPGLYRTFNIALIFLTVTAYGGLSVYSLLSHRAVEDSRMHCLSILLSPLFLVIENAFLHAFVVEQSTDNYYEVTMGVFSAAALGVTTFASLKFSFEISNKQKRFSETAHKKPDINLKKKGNYYLADIERNACYLCGVYFGEISKVEYVDIKRTGTKFILQDLFFPNRKILYKEGTDIKINTKDLCGGAPDLNNIKKDGLTYLIFRDLQNYYYFVKLPDNKCDYEIIGVNEATMSRLIYKFNTKKSKGDNRYIKHEAMDWFKIPYNFYA